MSVRFCLCQSVSVHLSQFLSVSVGFCQFLLVSVQISVVLKIGAFVLNMTGFLLNITLLVLNMTEILLNTNELPISRFQRSDGSNKNLERHYNRVVGCLVGCNAGPSWV